MSLPELVQDHLDGEQAVARVDLGGEDELFVTPTRTLIYRAEGLLSDESVEEYPHDAERIDIDEGRRKVKVAFDYGLDGERGFSLPKKKLDEALHPVLAGVLNAAGITDPGETVKRTFRFSELTLVVTSARVVKHVGQAVWDEDYEEFHFGDVTDVRFEEGNVATSVVLSFAGRQERFKTPNEEARAVRETLVDAVTAYHDVDGVEELRALSADDEEVADAEGVEAENVDFGEGPDPLGAEPVEVDEPENATREEPAGEADDGLGGGFTGATELASAEAEESSRESEAGAGTEAGTEDETAGRSDADVEAELAALREAVDRQTEQLERQAELIDQLIAELRQGR